MLNILIANKNIFYIKALINNIYNTYIKTYKIATDGKEALELLKTNDIDIIILDLELPKYDGYYILNILLETQKENFIHSIIVSTSKLNFDDKLKNNPMIYHCTKEDSLKVILKKLNEMIGNKHKMIRTTYIERRILKEINYLGYNPTYKGTNYLMECLLLIVNSKENLINNLERNVYPQIAKKYNKTISNIKSNINQATTCMYYECESNKLKNYFNLNCDMKPKPKLVIYTILNKVL